VRVLRHSVHAGKGAEVSAFEDSSPEEKLALRREFENPEASRELRIAILTLVREGANEAKQRHRCPMCKNYLFYAPHHEALIEGHVYSEQGLAEIGITGLCEFCFDRVTAEPDE